MRQQFLQTMAAAAFAEAGEFETARQLVAQTDNNRKKVVIGLEGKELALDKICQTLKLCERVDASLEILHVIHDGEDDSSAIQQNFERQLNVLNVHYTSVKSERSLHQEMIAQTKKRQDVVFVVLPPASEGQGKPRGLRKLSEKFRCPVVLLH